MLFEGLKAKMNKSTSLLFIHHSGKSSDRGIRGSTVLLGACDSVYNISKKDKNLVQFKVEKQKHYESTEMMLEVTKVAEHETIVLDSIDTTPPIEIDLSCTRCQRTSHVQENCYANTTIDGKPIPKKEMPIDPAYDNSLKLFTARRVLSRKHQLAPEKVISDSALQYLKKRFPSELQDLDRVSGIPNSLKVAVFDILSDPPEIKLVSETVNDVVPDIDKDIFTLET
jgi:hypothetical protein